MENRQKLISIPEEQYEIDIQLFGVFVMKKVMEKYTNGGKLTIIIEDEFKKYKKQYLKNGKHWQKS